MKTLPKLLAATAISVISIALPASKADAYQVDCAILLCLAGGWPASAECSYARSVFIRRITPFPIEPPLQIWRCPLGAAFQQDDNRSPWERLYDVAFSDAPPPGQPDPDGFPIIQAQGLPLTERPASPIAPVSVVLRQLGKLDSAAFPELAQAIPVSETADIDISDPVYDFVRSINVYDIDYSAAWRGGEESTCVFYKNRIRQGYYGTQGDFNWRRSSYKELLEPEEAWLGFRVSRNLNGCPQGHMRAVGVEWRDYEGNHGFEVVNY